MPKGQITPNVAKAKARKLRNRKKRAQALVVEAARKGVTVEALKREKFAEAEAARKSSAAYCHSGSSSVRGGGRRGISSSSSSSYLNY